MQFYRFKQNGHQHVQREKEYDSVKERRGGFGLDICGND